MENESEYKLTNYMLNNIHSLPTLIPPPSQQPTIMKIDSGASGTYIRYDDKHLTPNSIPTINGPNVILPDSSSITPNSVGNLNIPGLSSSATKAYLFQIFVVLHYFLLGNYAMMVVMSHSQTKMFQHTNMDN